MAHVMSLPANDRPPKPLQARLDATRPYRGPAKLSTPEGHRSTLPGRMVDDGVRNEDR
jgi:hypothetical protein